MPVAERIEPIVILQSLTTTVFAVEETYALQTVFEATVVGAPTATVSVAEVPVTVIPSSLQVLEEI